MVSRCTARKYMAMKWRSKLLITFLLVFVISLISCRINSLINSSLLEFEDDEQNGVGKFNRSNILTTPTEWTSKYISGRSVSLQEVTKIAKYNTKVKARTNASPIVFPLTLTGDYILNNIQICAGVAQVTALVMVHTAPKHFVRRQNIRSTYGSREMFGDNVRVVFLLGLVKDQMLQRSIEEESKKYGDIVQGNFIDSYHNLTHKGVMGFRWITEHCSHVKYVVKVDDDAVFDMWRFLKIFGHKNGSKSILCHAIYSGIIFRKGKWKMEESFMNGIKRWPWTYCPGFVVILTGDVIKPLFQAAHTTPFLWIDDVYLYGYLPFQANRTHIYQMPRMMQVDAYSKGVKCLLKKGPKCEYIAVGGNEKTFMKYWTLMKERNEIKVMKSRKKRGINK